MIREANQILIRFAVLGFSCTHFSRRASLIKLKAELKQCYKDLISLQPAIFIQTLLSHFILQGKTRAPSPSALDLPGTDMSLSCCVGQGHHGITGAQMGAQSLTALQAGRPSSGSGHRDASWYIHLPSSDSDGGQKLDSPMWK